MLDCRVSLPQKTVLSFAQAPPYTIIEEIGRGASCLVYHAYYMDTQQQKHFVRIKEFYPYELHIERKSTGELCVTPLEMHIFEDEKTHFVQVYKRNADLQCTLGLVNSTADVMNLYEKNQTYYIVMSYVESTDYRSYVDEDIQSVFMRLHTVANVVKKYHDIGMLHLDIKPENILLLPETKEHVVLLDFDSMLEKSQLYSVTTLRLSCSDGYAAPELVQGNRSKICEATDIYSIGAIVFEKLFHRKPKILDGSIVARYPLHILTQKESRYQPEFLRCLNTFFHKTLATTIQHRYKTIDEVLSVLKQLIVLSDMKRVFVYHTFSYHKAGFVGREQELKTIAQYFDSYVHVLFLSGLGGIGKTELAKRYAYLYQKKYRTILFVSFSESIIQTVCSEEIHIHTIHQQEDESIEAYFIRKLNILCRLLRRDDLLILDNFDVACDEHLEQLFMCQCQFLVTTREDFSDYDYAQIRIKPFSSTQEIWALFHTYNKCFYDVQQQQAIATIFEYIQYHTMTIELIAKYLRITQQEPKTLLKLFLEKEGITQMTYETLVKNRKDSKLRAETVHKHLLILFDISQFGEAECEIMRSFSVLGYIRVQKTWFIQHCPIEQCEMHIQTLIQHGWITSDDTTQKISVHPIVVDLCYNHLQPCSERVPALMQGMIAYLKEKQESGVASGIRKKVVQEFENRISGNDFAYATFCYWYCKKIEQRYYFLERAEEICLSLQTRESYQLLQNIYCLQIYILSTLDNMWNAVVMEETYDNEQLFLQDMAQQICTLAKKTYDIISCYINDPNERIVLYLSLVDTLCHACTENMFLYASAEEERIWAYTIFDVAVVLLDAVDKELVVCTLSDKEKFDVVYKMFEFFGCDDVMMPYRFEHCGDFARACRYQKQLQAYGNIDADEFLFFDTDEFIKKIPVTNTSKIIEVYETAYALGIESYTRSYQKLAQYLKTQNHITQAIFYLERILEKDKEQLEKQDIWARYSGDVCCTLVAWLIEADETERAKTYARELVAYATKPDKTVYQYGWLIYAYYILYTLTGMYTYWTQAISNWMNFPKDGDVQPELIPFLRAFAQSQDTIEQKIAQSFVALERLGEIYCTYSDQVQILNDIIQWCQTDTKYAHALMQAYLYPCTTWNVEDEQKMKQERYPKCKMAEQYYITQHLTDPYWYHKIKQTLCTYIEEYEQQEEEQKKCNHYLIALEESKTATLEQKIDIWKKAVDAYYDIHFYHMQEKCYKILMPLWQSILGNYEFHQHDSYFYEASREIDCYLKQGKTVFAKEKTTTLYEMLVAYCLEQGYSEISYSIDIHLTGCIETFLNIGCPIQAGMVAVQTILLVLGISEHPIHIDETFDIETATQQLQHLLEHTNFLHADVIDSVSQIYKQAKHIFQQEPLFIPFATALSAFSQKYEYQLIEFTR